MMRKTVKDTEILGHYVPGDTLIAVSPMLNHYLSEYWTEPMRFDPLRFTEPRRKDQSTACPSTWCGGDRPVVVPMTDRDRPAAVVTRSAGRHGHPIVVV